MSVGVLFSAGEEERERGRGTTHFPQPGKEEGAAANDGKWDYGWGKPQLSGKEGKLQTKRAFSQLLKYIFGGNESCASPDIPFHMWIFFLLSLCNKS